MYARGVEPGDLIADRYVVERLIARGGMGYVVAAKHIGFGDRVAIKIMFPESAGQNELVERFLREGRVARRISSPHVVQITDVGKLHSGTPFMIMEYLDGIDLAALLRAEGPLPVQVAVDYLLQACEALAEAHAMGIVHRDLKPSNLFLTKRANGQPHIKVLDFGIAKASTGVPVHTLTHSHTVMGSGPYMSPEQLAAARTVDPRSDIWALGVLLFELTTGKQPFDEPSLPQVFSRILHGEPTPITDVKPDAPPALASAIQTCLRKERVERFRSVADFATAVQELASDSGKASVAFIQSLALRNGALSLVPTPRPNAVDMDVTTVRARPTLPKSSAPSDARDQPTMVSTDSHADRALVTLDLVVGHSDDPDTREAIAEVLETCRSALGDRSPKAALLMAGIDHQHEILLDHIAAQWPGLPLIGCTTDGEVSSLGHFKEDSVALLLFVSDRLTFSVGLGTRVADDPNAAAREAVEQAKKGLDEPATLCLTTPASLIVSGVRVLDAIRHQLRDEVPVFGGTAGDQLRLEYTYQFCGTQVVKDGLPVLLVSGPLSYAAGISSGWRPIGTSGVVTKVQGNVVLEIDGVRASDFYIERIGKFSTPAELRAMVVSYPLAVTEPGADGYYLRSTFTVDLEAGAVHCLGDVPEGASVQIANGSRDDVLAGTSASIDSAMERFGAKTPSGVLVFSCAARRMLLGDRVGEEIDRIREKLPPGLPVFGFYTYGEIAPLRQESESKFHNMTCVSVVLGG